MSVRVNKEKSEFGVSLSLCTLTLICGAAGGVRFAHRPVASVLQIEYKHDASHHGFFFRLPNKSKLSFGFLKRSPPFGGVCFLLDRGAAGSSRYRCVHRDKLLLPVCF